MNNLREEGVSALLLGDYENDRVLLHDIFRKPGWRLFEARDRRRALDCLGQYPVHVVIAETTGKSWGWKSLLSDLRRCVQPPQLLVTSHTADDALWSEVLNFGAYDLLRQPLVRDEVERVVSAARRHFHLPPARARKTAVAAPAGAA